MPSSIIQERNSKSTVSATSIALAFSSNVTAASAVHAIFAQFQGTGGVKFSAFSDNNGGSYTTLDNAYNGGAVDFEVAHGYALNHAAGATTVTATTTTSSHDIDIWIKEIGGVATVSALDGHNIASSSSTTNQTLSVSATNANQPAIISVLGISEFQLQACTLTGVTQDVQGASWTYAVSGHLRITTTGSNTATVHVGAANDSFQIVMAIFDEPAITAIDGSHEPANALGPPSLRLGTPVSRLRSGILDIEPTQFQDLPGGEPQFNPLRLGTPFSRLRSSLGFSPPSTSLSISAVGLSSSVGAVEADPSIQFVGLSSSVGAMQLSAGIQVTGLASSIGPMSLSAGIGAAGISASIGAVELDGGISFAGLSGTAGAMQQSIGMQFSGVSASTGVVDTTPPSPVSFTGLSASVGAMALSTSGTAPPPILVRRNHTWIRPDQ